MRAMKQREKHGMCKTRAYRIWSDMRNRCENPNNRAYGNYGERGIHVCKRWRSFVNFLSDMGEPPLGQSLDRIDNDSGYSPENCRWASRKVQSRNRRLKRLLTVNGTTKSLCEWVDETGLSHYTILNRIKLGWSVDEAITTPLIRKRKGIKRGERIKDHQEYGDRHGVPWSDPAYQEMAA